MNLQRYHCRNVNCDYQTGYTVPGSWMCPECGIENRPGHPACPCCDGDGYLGQCSPCDSTGFDLNWEPKEVWNDSLPRHQ